MKHIARALITLATLTLGACVDVDTRIALAPDGRGTIETTAVLTPMIALMLQIGTYSNTDPGTRHPDLCSQFSAPPPHEGITITHSVPPGHSPKSACIRTATTTNWQRDLKTLFAGTLIEVRAPDHHDRIEVTFDAASAIERISSDPEGLCTDAADTPSCLRDAQRIAQALTDLPDLIEDLHDALGTRSTAPNYRLTIEGAVRAVHGFTPAAAANAPQRATLHRHCDPASDPGCADMLRSIRWAFEAGPTS